MFYQLSRLGISEINQRGFGSQFSGSSKYKSWNDELITKEKPRKIIEMPTDTEPPQVEDLEVKEKKGYSLRKNKIRNKILNFFSLNASKKFCAFYSISFPKAFPDDIAYKILNTWLTRCRQDLGLKSYLWVAERQKNNTLHFHLITNNFMPIRKANSFMRECIKTQNSKNNLGISENIINRYNGVDVDNIWENKKGRQKKSRLNKTEATRKISYYLTKYISKNNTTSQRLPWHCSRDISALFISINYKDVTMSEVADIVSNNPEAVTSYYSEHFTMHYFKFVPLEEWFTPLIDINNKVYEKFNPN